MTFVLVAVDRDGTVFVGGDAQAHAFETREDASLVSAEHYGWINDDHVFAKAQVVELSAYASPDRQGAKT